MQKPSNATRRAARLVRAVVAPDFGPSRSRKGSLGCSNIVTFTTYHAPIGRKSYDLHHETRKRAIIDARAERVITS